MTGLCHCGMMVMVYAGRKGVWCPLSIHRCVVVRISAVCVVMRCVMTVHVLSCRIVLRVVEWRWWGGCVWSRRSSSSSSSFCLLLLLLLSLLFLVLVFGVVRAQPCEHARYPRTPLCLLFSLLFHSPPFLTIRLSFLLEWRWVIHHVSECCVGMTAMGSLSRSSSFFW